MNKTSSNLTYLRKTYGLTTEQLGCVLNRSERRIVQWETREKFPDHPSYRAITLLFGITQWQLLREDLHDCHLFCRQRWFRIHRQVNRARRDRLQRSPHPSS